MSATDPVLNDNEPEFPPFSEYIEPFLSDDDYETAGKVLDDLGVSDRRARFYIVPFLAHEIKHKRRHQARVAERTIIPFDLDKMKPRRTTKTSNSSFKPVPRPVVPAREDIAARMPKWFHATFNTGDRSDVTWGWARRADHQQRVRMQTTLRNGINTDIALHLKADKKCEEFGVDRLVDIPPDEWPRLDLPVA